MLTTKAITVRIDGATKEQAERMLDDIGINMTNYIASSLKALIRERKVPFELAAAQHMTDQSILQKLAEAETEAANPETVWLSQDDVFTKVREKYAYEI